MNDKGDYIKREDAYNKICSVCYMNGYCMGHLNDDNDSCELKDFIDDIPSADVVEREVYEDLKEAYDVAQHYALERKEELERMKYLLETTEQSSMVGERVVSAEKLIYGTGTGEVDYKPHFCEHCVADMRGNE